MVYSMTGYGRKEVAIGNKQVVIEIKTLNGKTFDIIPKISPMLRPYELELRNLLQENLKRGTLDVAITVRQDGAGKPMAVNTQLARYYFESMKSIATDTGLEMENVLSTIMRMPEVVGTEQEVLNSADWTKIKEAVMEVIRQVNHHRSAEGSSLQTDLLKHLDAIESAQIQIAPLEAARRDKIKDRITSFIEAGNLKMDDNRLEQELIFYIERLDISEEQTRLSQHCKFFREELMKEEKLKGKVLGFILQEVGREINTLGAKANDAEIQKIVVKMKDELEKAKEQILNVL